MAFFILISGQDFWYSIALVYCLQVCFPSEVQFRALILLCTLTYSHLIQSRELLGGDAEADQYTRNEIQ